MLTSALYSFLSVFPRLTTRPSQTQAMIALVLTWRFIPKLFGGIVVLRLPFEPPGFFQKATHRGLEGADVRDASAVGFFCFFFAICTCIHSHIQVTHLLYRYLCTCCVRRVSEPFWERFYPGVLLDEWLK